MGGHLDRACWVGLGSSSAGGTSSTFLSFESVIAGPDPRTIAKVSIIQVALSRSQPRGPALPLEEKRGGDFTVLRTSCFRQRRGAVFLD